MSAFYRSSVTQILLSRQSTRSVTLWTSISCSSMSLDSVDWRTGDKFCSLRKLSAAITSWILCQIKWLKSTSPIERNCLSRNSAFLCSLLNTFSSISNYLESFLCPRKSSKPLLTLAKVHIVGARQFVQGCCSVVDQFRLVFVVWRCERKDNFIVQKRVKYCFLEKKNWYL